MWSAPAVLIRIPSVGEWILIFIAFLKWTYRYHLTFIVFILFYIFKQTVLFTIWCRWLSQRAKMDTSFLQGCGCYYKFHNRLLVVQQELNFITACLFYATDRKATFKFLRKIKFITKKGADLEHSYFRIFLKHCTESNLLYLCHLTCLLQYLFIYCNIFDLFAPWWCHSVPPKNLQTDDTELNQKYCFLLVSCHSWDLTKISFDRCNKMTI